MRLLLDDSITKLESVDSTSTWIQQKLQAGSLAPLAVLAAEQTAGRGRRGRHWSSPKGNVYLSVAIPASWCGSEQAMRLVPLRVAAIVSRGIQKKLGIGLSIKWPNDLLFGGAKVGGVLCEGTVQGETFGDVVVGIGINANVIPVIQAQDSEVVSELNPVATSLREIIGSDVDVRELGCFIAKEIFEGWRTLDDDSLMLELEQRGMPEGSVWTETAAGTLAKNWFRMESVGTDGALRLIEIGDSSHSIVEVSSANHHYKLAAQKFQGTDDRLGLNAPLIVADIGNTKVKLALWKRSYDAEPQTTCAILWGDVSANDGLTGFVEQIESALSNAGAPISGWPVFALSVNVQGLRKLSRSLMAYGLRVVPLKKKHIRVTTEYDLAGIGFDRLAAIEGWLTTSRAPAVIVSCGTAITVDVLASGGRHLGGFIAPGNSMALQALHENTSLLPSLTLSSADDCNRLGSNTRTAILGGVAQMSAGLVLRALELGEANENEIRSVVLCGGDAQILSEILSPVLLARRVKLVVQPDLVLRGAREIALGGTFHV